LVQGEIGVSPPTPGGQVDTSGESKMRRMVQVLAGLATMMVTSAEATIWRVDANSATAAIADFKTLQEAHDGAQSGDTLYVAGSATSYGDLIATKKLVIVGPGYFLEENADTQYQPLAARIGVLDLRSGSDGSVISGISVHGAGTVKSANVVLKRNRFTNSRIVAEDVANLIIVQNYMDASSAYHDDALRIDGATNGVIVANNFIHSVSSTASYKAIEMAETVSNVTVVGNVLRGYLTIYNTVFRNNIIKGSSPFSAVGCIIQNNLSESTQVPDGVDGNQTNIDMATVFVGGTSDGQYQLEQGSPAIGAGVNGEDIGMFGGTTPYVLSGLPPIPTIVEFDAPATASNASGVPVRLRVKARN
jgi:hypothetical protein